MPLALRSLMILIVILHGRLVTSGLGYSCFSVTTFNAGLTPVVAKVNRRIPVIQQAIRNERTDVMCLQEVWYERSVKDLTEDLEETYPYHYSKLHQSVGELSPAKPASSFPWLKLLNARAACSASELAYIVQKVGSCAVRNQCIGSKIDQIGSCLAKKCRSELRSRELSQSCLSCTLFSLTSLTTTLSECARLMGEDNRFNGPGLVLLSKKKILSVRYVKYFPYSKMWVERGYIEANIEGVGKVVCTHLSANMDHYLEFDTYFQNYRQQQAAEIRRLSRFRFTEHILLGDLNTGPAITFPYNPDANISANFLNNYKKLMNYGYKNPYIKEVKLCTYCKYNQYTKKDLNWILDHVMLRGDKYTGVVPRRVLSTYGSRQLSDHVGVQLNFCIRNPSDLIFTGRVRGPL